MNQNTLTWVDVGHRERMTVVPSVAGSAATVDLMRVLSGATLTTASNGLVVATGASAPSEDQYCDLDDTWVVHVEDLDSNPTLLFIPAARTAFAQADGVNYVQTSAQWLAIGAIVTNTANRFSGEDNIQLDGADIARNIERAEQPWFKLSSSIDWARRSMRWYGTHGRSRLTHIIGPVARLGAQFQAVQDAFVAVSAAVVTHYWEDVMAIYDDPPLSSLYSSVEDACHVWFQDDAGNITEVTIPAPQRSIFLADGKTLNVAQSDVAAFITSAIAELAVPVSGLPVTSCIGGHLSKRSVY